MNKYITALLISLASVSVEAGQKYPAFLEALWHGAEAKIELHVADDGGTPVESAKVKAYLGMNFRPKGKWFAVKGRVLRYPCHEQVDFV